MSLNMKFQTVKTDNINTTPSVNYAGVITFTEKNIHLGTGDNNIKYGDLSDIELSLSDKASLSDLTSVTTRITALENNKVDLKPYITSDAIAKTYATKTELTNLGNTLVTKETYNNEVTTVTETAIKISNRIGDMNTLTTKSKDTIVNALNELNHGEYDDSALKKSISNLESSLSSKADTADLLTLKNSVESNIGTFEQTIEDIRSNINEQVARVTTEVGLVTDLETTDKTSIVNAINELNKTVDTIQSSGYDDTKLKTELNSKMPKIVYTAGKAITTNDLVIYAGKVYLANSDFTATDWDTDSVNLLSIDSPTLEVKDYAADVAFVKNELMLKDNKLYIANSSFTTTDWATDEANFTETNIEIDLSNYYTKTEVSNLVNSKQEKLTAGSNIKIVDGVISATVTTSDGSVVSYDDTAIRELIQKEVSNRNNSVADLTTKIENVSGKLTQEVNTRTTEAATFTEQLTKEVEARKLADDDLNTKIGTTDFSSLAPDLSKAVVDLDTKIEDEITNRTTQFNEMNTVVQTIKADYVTDTTYQAEKLTFAKTDTTYTKTEVDDKLNVLSLFNVKSDGTFTYTSAEYEALTDDEKNNGKMYVIVG